MKKNDVAKTLQDAVQETTQVVADLADDLVTAAQPVVSNVAKEVAEKAEPAIRRAKKAGKNAISTVIPEVYVQANGQEYSCGELLERAKADYKKTHKVGIHSCRLYVKPEDKKAYYVINKYEGVLEL